MQEPLSLSDIFLNCKKFSVYTIRRSLFADISDTSLVSIYEHPIFEMKISSVDFYKITCNTDVQRALLDNHTTNRIIRPYKKGFYCETQKQDDLLSDFLSHLRDVNRLPKKEEFNQFKTQFKLLGL